MTELVYEILTEGRAETFSITFNGNGWVASIDGAEGPVADTLEAASDICAELFLENDADRDLETEESRMRYMDYRYEKGF